MSVIIRELIEPRRCLPQRRERWALGPAALVTLAVLSTACGSSPEATTGTTPTTVPPLPAGTLKVSPASGAPGSVVHLTGDAGAGCVVDKNWYGFSFERAGDVSSGPVTTMATPLQTNGSWTATFVIPTFLGGSAQRGAGAMASPGRYEFTAPDCKGGKVAKVLFALHKASDVGGPNYVAIAPTTDGLGYWLAQADGSVHAYGDAKSYGPAVASSLDLAAPVVGMTRTAVGHGYWLVTSKGHVYSFGDAHNYGSLTAAQAAPAPVVSIAEAPAGTGYWLLAANGTVFGFGGAHAQGHPSTSSAPYDAIMTRNAGGYIITSAANGATYLYPGGTLTGGGAGTAFSASQVGSAATPSGNGAWEAGADGGVTTIGDATFYGSVPGLGVTLTKPVTAIAALPNGLGYWLLSGSGSVYPFGSAQVYKKS